MVGVTETDEAADPAAGLRERKKLATRQALAEAALNLALERGWHGFTVADVAEAVDVSRRTFSNYFASKAECLAAVSDAWLDEVLDSVRDAPADVPLDQVMLQALLTVSTEAPDRWERFARVVTSEPELEAVVSGMDNARVARVAEVIAGRVELDRARAGRAGRIEARAADDPRIELMAIFCVTAGRLCLQWWLTEAEPRRTDALAQRLRLAFSLIDLHALTGTPDG